MPKQVRTTARDVFFYLLMIVTLYISVISFITLLFQFVNLLVPDAFDYLSSITSAVRAATAALVVTWPVFIFISYVTEKDITEAPEKLRLGIRRWLLYLTLFIASITIIVDLIVLINEFMGGDLTMRFFLKTIAVLLVAAAIFGYYLRALKDESKNKPYIKFVAAGSTVFVIAAIIGGFIAVGSPSKQRGIRFDQERLNDLSNIQYQLINYYQEKSILPEKLSDITTGLNQYEPPVDPETEQAYIYKKTGELTFELCATFATEYEATEINRRTYLSGVANDWEHPTGEHCFERTIDPDFYLDEKPVPTDIIEPVAY